MTVFHSLRVFLVEDMPNMQAALRSLLDSHAGFDVVGSARTQAAAVQWLHEHPQGWDVVSLDLVLDDGSGFSIIRRCRELRPAGTVVVFSEFITEAIREHCLSLGADAVFSKQELAEYSDFMHAIRNPSAR